MGPEAADLDQRALHAAEAAIREGERALTDARAETEPAPVRRRNPRELALRVLLGVNLLAMATIALLPSPRGDAARTPVEAPAPLHDPVVVAPDPADPVIRAFAAADRRDYREAIRLLEDHLNASPRLDPAKKANLLLALEHYATQLGDFGAAQGYQRRTDALRSSHSMPDDLVQMALQAEQNGDVASMRRHYARLLLQQRQIPSALYRHVAEAYLKLGDSYRQEATAAEQAARARELEELRERLRRQALQAEAPPETGK
jgi:hypothetical protein